MKKPKDNSKSVSRFAQEHKNLLVMVLDPSDDSMFMSYKGVTAYNKIKTADGQDHGIVKGVLKASTFKSHIDYLIGSFVEVMKIPVKNKSVNQFLAWVDGALYNIANKVNPKK